MPKRYRSQQSTPGLITTLAVIGLAFIAATLVALFFRVDWSDLPELLSTPRLASALAISFTTALCATVLCILLGVPLGIWIARLSDRLAAWMRAIVLIPLLMPPLVGGLALIALFGRRGVLGAFLAEFGVSLPFSTSAVIIAQTFVALPFLVIAVEQAHRSADPRFEQVARTLGANRTAAFWRVTIPMMRSAIVAGATMSFARALAEFGATALFAGNVDGVTRTMPMAIYTSFNGTGGGPDEAYALAAVLIIAAIAVMLGLRAWQPTESAGSEKLPARLERSRV